MHPPFQLAQPQNQRGSDDDAHPFVESQGHHTEHFTAESDDENLAESYY